ETRSDGDDVRRDRPRPAAAAQMRLRPGWALEPRQGVPAIAPLCGARPAACPSRPPASPRPAEILKKLPSCKGAKDTQRSEGAPSRILGVRCGKELLPSDVPFHSRRSA